MNRLEIPERAKTKAVDALYEARLSKRTSVGDAAEFTLIAGGAIIVAAAFRRFAEVATCEQDRSLARTIAGELDPEGADGG